MSVKDILFSQEARSKILEGVNMLGDAVGSTLGPKGRIVTIERSYGSPKLTKDGVSVAREIELHDKFENLGAQLVREVAGRTNDTGGDGTTTATILAQFMINEGFKLVAAGANPMDLKRGIDKSVNRVVEHLKANREAVSEKDQSLDQVATISSNNDPEIGKLIGEVMKSVGRDGVVTVEEAKGTETTYELVKGMQFDKGYLSPYFVTDSEKMRAELGSAYILVHEQKISSANEFMHVLDLVAKSGSGKPLLVIAEDVEGQALAAAVLNKIHGALKVAAVKAPGFGDRRKAMLGDIAVLTGGRVISEEIGKSLKDVTLEDLGRAHSVSINKDSTIIVGGEGKKEDIEARRAQIQAEVNASTSDYDKEKLQERLGKLKESGVAIIKVAGYTETEIKETKDRVEDALSATRAALEEGIIPGGGAALLYASAEAFEGLRFENEDQRFGMEIVKKSLLQPMKRICDNAGVSGEVVTEKLLESKDRKIGYDAQKGEHVNMIKSGIVDPLKVTRCALQNAASISGLIITVEAAVVEKPEAKPTVPGGGMPDMGGGMM